MFPLVTTLLELRQAKMVLADAMEDLDEEGTPFDRKLPVGMMVEVPATVMILDQLLEEVDFISIGTNDLIQYTLAVDRSNSDVAELYQAGDPAVLRLIDLSIRQAAAAQRAGQRVRTDERQVTYTMLLLGLGLRSFSVTPSAIPEMKKVCRSVSIPQCQEVARRAMQLYTARDIERTCAKNCARFPGAASLTTAIASDGGRPCRTNLT